MKQVNLISIVQAFRQLDPSIKDPYFQSLGIEPEEAEIDDLESLINSLRFFEEGISLFDKYFLNYSIPQISKEFDLLRFGKESVINVELKRESTEAKIIKQLTRNRYYLSFLDKDIYSYTYVSSEEKLYTIDDDDNLIEVPLEDLLSDLIQQEIELVPDIDSLFNPSNYLVSPFNSTKEFIAGAYFLTDRQQEIQTEIIKTISKKPNSFFSICGKAGTGKTLLTYDIAKSYMEADKGVLIIHCGKLNDGHFKLRAKYGWKISAVKGWGGIDFSEYALTVIDEAQRIYPFQLEEIIKGINKAGGGCIFSYDRKQCLRKWEESNNIESVIEEKTSAPRYELTDKIRTNKEIADFIGALFDKGKPVKKTQGNNVELTYFKTSDLAKSFIELLGDNGWKIINYTPSSKHTHPYEAYSVGMEDNAHGVIGQEFDKVVAVLDAHFFYDSDNKLAIRDYKDSPYYHPVLMLFQIVTRTRKKLHLVIINNAEVMERCLSITA